MDVQHGRAQPGELLQQRVRRSSHPAGSRWTVIRLIERVHARWAKVAALTGTGLWQQVQIRRSGRGRQQLVHLRVGSSRLAHIIRRRWDRTPLEPIRQGNVRRLLAVAHRRP